LGGEDEEDCGEVFFLLVRAARKEIDIRTYKIKRSRSRTEKNVVVDVVLVCC
jgi:hypothetical protein